MRDMLRPLAIQDLKKSAEDCYAVGTLDRFCYMGVFDGCGGLGCQQISFQSETFPNHTSAWIASRVGAAAVESFFRENGNQSFSREKISELEQVLNETFQTLKKKYWKDDGVSGSMRRNFPTTASILVKNLQEQNVFFLWSGDSRGYLCDKDGLAQMTQDDIRFHATDAFANLYQDSAMTKQWNADRTISVHCKEIHEISPAIYICATDGCFGFLSSPMEFEYMLLSTLKEADTPKEWEEKLIAQWLVHFGDDCTMTILPVGFTCFSDLKTFYQNRLHVLETNYQNSFSDETDVEERRQLWQKTYRTGYYRFRREDFREE